MANSTAANSTIGVPRPEVINDSVLAKTVPYADNSQQFVDIPRGQCVRWIALRITAQPTALSGWTAANLGAADLASLIKQVQIIRNGSDAHTTLTGEQCIILQNRWYGSPARSSVGTIGAANPSMSFTMLIPLETPALRKPYATILNTGKCSGLTLNFTFGDYTTVLSTATAWTVAPNVQVSLGTEYWPPDKNGKDTTPVFFFRRLKPKSAVIAAGAQTDIPISLPVNTKYHGVLIGGTPMAYCTKIKVQNASTALRTFALPDRSDVQRIRRSVQALGVSSTVTNDANTYWLDFMPDGMLTHLLDARVISELDMIATFSSANPGGTVNYITSEIFGNDAIAGG